MSRKRKAYGADLKAKVELAAVRGLKTVSELASERGVRPTLICQWKKRLLSDASTLFDRRAMENVFVERLWQTVKHENVSLQDDATGEETETGFRAYFAFYGTERPHQTLNSRTPASVSFGG